MIRWRRWVERHRTILLGIGATVLMFILLGFFMNWIVMPLYTHRGAEDELPDVTELSFNEAKELLESRGFQIIMDRQIYNSTYPESTVVLQNPEPYTRVKKGRRIYVTLSAGVRMIPVPQIVGSSERDASFILRQAGLQLGEVFYEFDNYYPSGVVCRQVFQEGTEVEEQTAVDIAVSLGGRLPDRFEVPEIVGKSLETAKKIIRQAGLQVGFISYEVERSLIPDTVIGQSIEPGEDVRQGQPIDLVVSRLDREDPWEK
jgi:beta-lactam-binding protein with PASTA domain